MNEIILTERVMLIRLLLSFLAGCCIGLERSGKRQIAGLRTHILICMGACGMMLVSLWISQMKSSADPGRIAAQVVSGIGFLGAGAILKIGANVKGLTTAASIWVIAGIGLAFGSGLYVPAAAMTALSLLTLSLVNRIELKIFPSRQNKFLQIFFYGTEPPMKEILRVLSETSISVVSTNVNIASSPTELSEVDFFANVPKKLDVEKLLQEMKKINGIDKIGLKEKLGAYK